MLSRRPLLLEGVKKAMSRWEKAHTQLSRITKRGYRKHQKRLAKWEQQRPGESAEQHVERVRSSWGDEDQRIHDQIVNEPKMRSRLDRAQEKEARRRTELAKAEQRREEKQRRKQLMQAPVPSLEPTPSRTLAAAGQAGARALASSSRPRVKKMFPVRRRA